MSMEGDLIAEVREFIDKQDIYSDETIYQCDNVLLNALEFIERVVEIVGYKPEEKE